MDTIDQASGDCTETSSVQLQPVSLLLPEIKTGLLKPVVRLKRLDVQRSLSNRLLFLKLLKWNNLTPDDVQIF